MCAVFHNSCLPVLMPRCTPTQKGMFAILFHNLSLTSAKYSTFCLFPCSFHEVDKRNRSNKEDICSSVDFFSAGFSPEIIGRIFVLHFALGLWNWRLPKETTGSWTPWILKIGRTGCLETSVTKYETSPSKVFKCTLSGGSNVRNFISFCVGPKCYMKLKVSWILYI